MWLISGTVSHETAKIQNIKYAIIGKSVYGSNFTGHISVVWRVFPESESLYFKL